MLVFFLVLVLVLDPQLAERRPDLDHVPLHETESLDDPGVPRRDLDGGLVRLHLAEGAELLDDVALGDLPRDELALLDALARLRERDGDGFRLLV